MVYSQCSLALPEQPVPATSGPDPERPGVRLYLPNPGLDKIRRAIDWLDPVKEAEQRSRPPVNLDWWWIARCTRSS